MATDVAEADEDGNEHGHGDGAPVLAKGHAPAGKQVSVGDEAPPLPPFPPGSRGNSRRDQDQCVSLSLRLMIERIERADRPLHCD